MKKIILTPIGHIVCLNHEERNAFFSQCYEELYEAMFAIAYGFFENEQDAEDQVADFFEKMMSWPIARFSEKENLAGYILIALRRHCINSTKKQDRRKHLPEYDALNVRDLGTMIERNFIFNESLEVIMSAVARLPKPQYEALMLRAQGSEYKEIAAELGISESAATSRVNRARYHLRGLIHHLVDD